jgi:diguanylate cyclase (GGDEF)-like protein
VHKIAREHVFDEINEGIIVLDQSDKIVDYNQAAKNTFSWLNSKAIGKSMFTYPEGTAIGKNASCQFTSEIIRNNQKKYLGFTITNIIQKNEPIGKILIFQDTTEQKDALEKLNYLATNDSLTGIFNRSKLMEEAEKELYKAYLYKKDLSALMIDIDFFKKVNDTYGHLAGDKVITCLANVCKNRLRKSDIIGRYGGEEFLVLLSDTNLQNALQIAEDLRILIEKTDIEYDCKVIKVQVSLGVTSTSIHSEKVRINDLINESDIALYKAKNSGRNRVCSI